MEKIVNIVYTSPLERVENKHINTRVVYTNSYDEEINKKTCFLRSDLVLLGNTPDSKEEEAFCSWYLIDTLGVDNFATLTGDTKLSLMGTFTKEQMNYIFKTINKSPFNVTVLSESNECPSFRIAQELLKRQAND